MVSIKNYPIGVRNFIHFLISQSIDPILVELSSSTHTALAAANAVGCTLSQIVKSILFVTQQSHRPLLVLVSGVNRANTQRLSEIIGEKVKLADEQTVLQITHYPIGAVPPAGFDKDLYTIIDEDLASHEQIWTSGGSNHSMVSISFKDLCRITKGEVTTIIRPLAEPVIIVPYDPQWPIKFNIEKEIIQMAIGNYLKAIEHIGSTSVPGLAAKPIIDIMAGAQNLADAPQFIPLLETHGYHYFPEYEAQIPERRYLTKSINGRTVVHLHIIEPTNQLWEEHLTFRDRLLAQPVLRNDYARLKTELAKHFGNDRVGYTEAKSAFIQTALKQNTH